MCIFGDRLSVECSVMQDFCFCKNTQGDVRESFIWRLDFFSHTWRRSFRKLYNLFLNGVRVSSQNNYLLIPTIVHFGFVDLNPISSHSHKNRAWNRKEWRITSLEFILVVKVLRRLLWNDNQSDEQSNRGRNKDHRAMVSSPGASGSWVGICSDSLACGFKAC